MIGQNIHEKQISTNDWKEYNRYYEIQQSNDCYQQQIQQQQIV
jgi:hypothetical protein